MPQNADPQPSFSRARRWAIGLNVLVSCLALLAVMALINYIASRHFERFQWSQRDRLSPLTLRLLESLTNEVRVVVFFDPENPLFRDVKGLIDEYRLRCARLDVEYVDYVRLPGRAAAIKQQYKLASAADKDLVIFESKGRPPSIVYDKELSDYDLSEAFVGKGVRRTAFKGEQLFTSKIVSVTESEPFKACFLQGHGEHNPVSEEQTEGYQKFSRVLEEKYISVEPLSLVTNDVPADCQLLVIAGPRNRLAQFELDKVQDYLKRGGRAFILLTSPLLSDGKKSGLETLLAEWGVGVGDNLVMDKAGNADQVLLAGNFGQHPIVKPLDGSRLGLLMPRSIERRASSSRTADTAKVAELVFTSSEGMKVTNVRDNRGTVETNGVVPLVVAVEKGTIQGVSPDRGSTRIVVVGDSLFLGNGMIEYDANRDFASLAVNWLLDRSHLLAIGPQPVREYRIDMTESQMRSARLVLIGGLPGTVLLLGLLVWVRRRR